MITNTEGKKLFFIEYSAGYCGSSEYERGFFENEDEAWKEYEVTAREHRENYDFDDEDDEFEDEIDLSVCEYDPDEHDGYFDNEYVFMEGVSKYKLFEKDIKEYEEATGKTLDMSVVDTTIDIKLYSLIGYREDEVFFRAYNKTHALIKAGSINPDVDINIGDEWEESDEGYEYIVSPNECYEIICYSDEYVENAYKRLENEITNIKNIMSRMRHAEV